jgi:predicted Zn-dependent peptidase
VKALDRDQLLKAHQARFVPGQALLLVVGQFDAKAVDAAIDRAFGSWKAGVQALPSVPPVNSAPRPGIVIKNRPDSVQTAMVLGRPALPAGHPDLPALSLAVEVAGGSFGSRITRNIREDKGYTYSPWMAISKNLLGGQLSERAAVRNAVTGAAVTEIFYELARMGTSEVPAEELAKAKRSLGGGYLFQTLTLDAYSMALASAWTKGQPAESLAAWVPQIQAVTAADVKKAARTYLNPRDFTVVAVGDEALIKEELAPFQPQR